MMLLGVSRWLLWCYMCCYGFARCCYGVTRWLLGVDRCC